MKKSVAFLIVVLMALAVEAATNEQVAGKVAFIKGSALAVQNAEVRPLSVGDDVLIGDILSTGAGSRLEISMIDEGTFKLGERTSFVVIDYTFGQGNDNAVVELLNGAMDGVSGAIAKASHDGMKVLTRQATIGIRGTKFFVGEMDNLLQIAHWKGGGVHVKNFAGEVMLSANDTGTTVSDPNSIPTPPAEWSGEKKKRALLLVH